MCSIKAHYAMTGEYEKNKIDNIFVNHLEKFVIASAPIIKNMPVAHNHMQPVMNRQGKMLDIIRRHEWAVKPGRC